MEELEQRVIPITIRRVLAKWGFPEHIPIDYFREMNQWSIKLKRTKNC